MGNFVHRTWTDPASGTALVQPAKAGAGIGIADKVIEEIRQEVPRLIVSLQARIRQLARALEGDANVVMTSRVDRALGFLQREIGDRCDREIERFRPGWLPARFEILRRVCD